jgi:hypothetical protein
MARRPVIRDFGRDVPCAGDVLVAVVDSVMRPEPGRIAATVCSGCDRCASRMTIPSQS